MKLLHGWQVGKIKCYSSSSSRNLLMTAMSSWMTSRAVLGSMIVELVTGCWSFIDWL
jgi:hypothetical protein